MWWKWRILPNRSSDEDRKYTSWSACCFRLRHMWETGRSHRMSSRSSPQPLLKSQTIMSLLWKRIVITRGKATFLRFFLRVSYTTTFHCMILAITVCFRSRPTSTSTQEISVASRVVAIPSWPAQRLHVTKRQLCYVTHLCISFLHDWAIFKIHSSSHERHNKKK